MNQHPVKSKKQNCIVNSHMNRKFEDYKEIDLSKDNLCEPPVWKQDCDLTSLDTSYVGGEVFYKPEQLYEINQRMCILSFYSQCYNHPGSIYLNETCRFNYAQISEYCQCKAPQKLLKVNDKLVCLCILDTGFKYEKKDSTKSCKCPNLFKKKCRVTDAESFSPSVECHFENCIYPWDTQPYSEYIPAMPQKCNGIIVTTSVPTNNMTTPIPITNAVTLVPTDNLTAPLPTTNVPSITNGTKGTTNTSELLKTTTLPFPSSNTSMSLWNSTLPVPYGQNLTALENESNMILINVFNYSESIASSLAITIRLLAALIAIYIVCYRSFRFCKKKSLSTKYTMRNKRRNEETEELIPRKDKLKSNNTDQGETTL